MGPLRRFSLLRGAVVLSAWLAACSLGSTETHTCPGGEAQCDTGCCTLCTRDADCPDDALFCNGTRYCDGDLCRPRPRDCEDDIGCTRDACNEQSQRCEHTVDDALCPVGQLCVIDQGCAAGIVEEPCRQESDCEDANPCTADACVAGVCAHTPSDAASCDDGVYCNGAETCAAGVCVSGTAPSCDDQVLCTVDFCDEALGGCRSLAGACAGGLLCDAVLDCVASETPCTQATAASDCDDGDPCTQETCSAVGRCAYVALPASSWYPDLDGDGFGNPTLTAATLCVAPGADWVGNNSDCDDNAALCGAACSPAAFEVCDGYDNDCQGGADDGLGPIADDNTNGECSGNTQVCGGLGGYVPAAGNYVPVAEACNGLDDNCDGATDEGMDPVPHANQTGPCAGNQDVCLGPAGYQADAGNYLPVAESCDDGDNNCAGGVDEGCDDDGDEYCDSAMPVVGVPATCALSSAGTGDDCDDADNAEHPGQQWYPDADGDTYGDAAALGSSCARASAADVLDNSDCDDDPGQCGPLCSPGVAGETCGDGRDNDCNTLIDEGCGTVFDTSGLVAYYPFDNADLRLTSGLGSVANGVNAGTPTRVNDAKVGSYAWSYYGASTSTGGTQWALGNGDWSISLWVKRVAAFGAGNEYIFDCHAAGNCFLLYYEGTGARYIFSVAGSPTFQFLTFPGSSAPAGVWSHLAVIKDGGTVSLYLNGVVQGSTTTAGDWTSLAEKYIGNYSGEPTSGGYDWNGYIDELSVWGRALSLTELRTLIDYDNGLASPLAATALNATGLRVYYDFEQSVAAGLRNQAAPTLKNRASLADLGLTPNVQESFVYADQLAADAAWLSSDRTAADGAGLVTVEVGNARLHFVNTRDGTNDQGALDLAPLLAGNAVSDRAWTLRLRLRAQAWSTGGESVFWVGLSDSDHTADSNDPQRAIGIELRNNAAERRLGVTWKDGGSAHLTDGNNVNSGNGSVLWQAGTDYILELSRRDGWAKVRLWGGTNAETGTLLASVTSTALPTTLTSLRYVKVSNVTLAGGATVDFDGWLDDVQLYNGRGQLPLGAPADVQATNVVSGAPGIMDQAVTLDDTAGAYLDAGTSVEQLNFLHSNTGQALKWSVAFWAKVDSIGANKILLDTANVSSSNAGLSLRLDTGGVLQAFINRNDAAGTVISASTTAGYIPDTSQWHHYVFTYDHTLAAGNLRVYRDGGNVQLFNKTANAPAGLNASYPMRIGWGAAQNDNRFDGSLDEVSIWTRALTPTEVLALHNAGSGVGLRGVSPLPASCAEHLSAGINTSGVYAIDPDGPGGVDPIDVYCDMTTDGGGWTLAYLSSPSATNKQRIQPTLYAGVGQGALDTGTDMYIVPHYGTELFYQGIALRLTWSCSTAYSAAAFVAVGPGALAEGVARWNDNRTPAALASAGGSHTQFSNRSHSGNVCQGDGVVDTTVIYELAIGNGSGWGNFIGWMSSAATLFSTAITNDTLDNVTGTVAAWFR